MSVESTTHSSFHVSFASNASNGCQHIGAAAMWVWAFNKIRLWLNILLNRLYNCYSRLLINFRNRRLRILWQISYNHLTLEVAPFLERSKFSNDSVI
jgi:hypothetical protein